MMLPNGNYKSPKIRSFFAEKILSAFQFLITEYGFQCVSVEMDFVRYESESVFVIIGRTFQEEIDIDIGLLKQRSDSGQEIAYSLGDIMELFGHERKSYYIVASTRQAVEEAVTTRAQQLATFASDALRAEAAIYAKLWEQSERRPAELAKSTHKNKVESLGRKVDIAWNTQQYSEVIRLYESIKEDLTHEEMSRLEYAKKQLQDKTL